MYSFMHALKKNILLHLQTLGYFKQLPHYYDRYYH